MALRADLLVTGASELITFGSLQFVVDGALAALGGKIVWVGPSHEAAAAVELAPNGRRVDAAGQVVLPGLIDCHSHFVFAGDRAGEFSQRALGASYLEIAAAGGGIQATVTATAEASDAWLVAEGSRRAKLLLAQGVTTSEAKSGYGATCEGELRLLRAIRAVGQATALEVRPTLLGLHALPRGADRGAYVREVVERLIPAVASEGLAAQFDAFLDSGAFTAGEVELAFGAARAAGLGLRLHGDQLTNGGGAELAGRWRALSADHLERVSASGIAALAAGGVTAVLAPVATLAMGLPFAPFADLRAAGVEVALCTNWNPGSAPTENIWLTVGLACLAYKMSPLEALRALTESAAQVLAQGARLGRLLPAYQADFVIVGCADHRHLASHWGVNHARQVFKGGVEVHIPVAASCRDS